MALSKRDLLLASMPKVGTISDAFYYRELIKSSDNLYPDPLFRTGIGGWSVNAGSNAPVRTQEQASFSGESSIKCERGAGTSVVYGNHAFQSHLNKGAGKYFLRTTVWCSPINPGTSGVRLGGTGINIILIPVSTLGSWVDVSFFFDWDGIGSVVLQAYTSVTTSNAIMYFGSVLVVPPNHQYKTINDYMWRNGTSKKVLH